MTVENQTNKKLVNGDGTTDTVTFNFKAISASDIKVYVYPEALGFADLEAYLQTGGGVDYEITLDADGEGGEIVFTTPPAANEIALIINELDFTQTADLPTEGNFNEEAVETALDRLVMQNIQQQERIVRGLSLRKEDPLAVDGFEGIYIEAEPAVDRALRLLQFNATGDGVEAGLLTTDITDIDAAVAAAQAAQAGAEAAEGGAVTAQGAAETAQTGAEAAQTAAEAAEANALSYADIALSVSGYTYTYSTNTAATDPSLGFLKFNNATLASATELYISETTNAVQAVGPVLASWDDSTSTVKGQLKIVSRADPSTFALFNITGTITDNGQWDAFTVAYVAGQGTLANNDEVSLQFVRTGDLGATGSVSDGDKGDITVSGSGTVFTIDNGVVTEAKMLFADNTTDNASTTKHGHMPKLSNSATLYFDGLGTQTNPALNAVLTGYTSGAGTVAATDTILQAIQKLNGNISAAGGLDIYQADTTSGSTVTITLTATYKAISFFFVNTSISSSGTISIAVSDDGTNFDATGALNQAGTGAYAGTGMITHTGVAATNKRVLCGAAQHQTSYASGSLGWETSHLLVTETGVTTHVRAVASAGSFDNGEIIVIGWK